MPINARSPPVRLKPIVATASAGMPSAAICVVGSMTRSGRNATQPEPSTRMSRASAAMPGAPASNRSSQFDGFSPLPNDSPVAAAVAAATYSTVPTNATIQIIRMNRTATRYSTPSGHAAAIVTSDPKRMATPRTESRRPSHSGPCPVSASVGLTTSLGVLVAFGSTAVVVASVVAVEVAAAGSSVVVEATGSFDTLNVRMPFPFGCPSVSLTNQLATHVPFGSGEGTGTVSVSPSPPISGRPSVTSWVLQSSETVLVSPNASENTIEIWVGEAAIVEPSAGSELTTAASAWTTPDSTSEPMATTPSAIAATAVVRRRRRRAGHAVRSFTVGPNLVVGESPGREPRRGALVSCHVGPCQQGQPGVRTHDGAPISVTRSSRPRLSWAIFVVSASSASASTAGPPPAAATSLHAAACSSSFWIRAR